MKPLLYKLDENKNAVPCDASEWLAPTKSTTEARRVAESYIGPFRVSTVFLGVDHAHGNGAPLLFETMVFIIDDPIDTYSRRYSTWTEAEKGHAETLTRLSIQLEEEEREALAVDDHPDAEEN